MNHLTTRQFKITVVITATIIVFVIISAMVINYLQPAPVTEKNSITTFSQRLADNKGKVILVDFWSSWCIPCRQSFPWMNQLQAQYSPNEFLIIGINLDHDRALAEQFLQETPAEFDIIYDPKGKIAKKYKLKGMPSSLIINKQGEIVSAHTGFNQTKAQQIELQIKKEIKKALLMKTKSLIKP